MARGRDEALLDQVLELLHWPILRVWLRGVGLGVGGPVLKRHGGGNKRGTEFLNLFEAQHRIESCVRVKKLSGRKSSGCCDLDSRGCVFRNGRLFLWGRIFLSQVAVTEDGWD
jgi:hypothetical protein